MTNIIWIEKSIVMALHDEQIAEHGGASGIRDEGLLDSALGKPQNLLSYEDPTPDISALAASYASGLVKNHPFIDGNKRTGLVVMELFLVLNGYELNASDEDCVLHILQLASGDVDEAGLAQWIRGAMGMG